MFSTRPGTSYRMDFDRYRDDQLNTGVIAALVGGFSLTNSWEMKLEGTTIDTITYVLAIIAVHSCTCSALTSAFLYRSLTQSDPEEAEAWMEKHHWFANLPFIKFVVGIMAYLASVILVAFKELVETYRAQLFTVIVGILGVCFSLGTLTFLCFDSPAHKQRKTLDSNGTDEVDKGESKKSNYDGSYPVVTMN